VTTTALALLMLVLTPAFAQDNLVTNPGFEDLRDGNPIGWGTRAGEAVEVRTDGGHEGESYVRFIDPKKGYGISLEAMRIPARPGGVYTASAWLRTSDQCSPGIYLNFFDDVGTRIHNLYTRAKGPTEGWVQATVTSAAPLDTAEMCVSLYAYMDDIGTFDADEVMMTVEGGAEPGSGGIPSAEPGDKSMVDIGSRLELFVDEFIIDSLSGEAQRRLHHPVPREVVLEFDRPWEGAYCGYFVAMNVDGKVRIYYRGWPELSGPDCTCVVESEDGIHFTRPSLGLFEWEGSKDNNIVWLGEGCHNFTPVRDANPNASEDQRFKALGKGPLIAFASPDGLKWRKLQDEPVITEGAFDSQNLAFWDTERQQYVEYHRGFKDGVRDVMMCTSDDFINWTAPQWLDYGDAPKEHLYTNAVVPYFRAPHIYLGFPCRFVPGRKKVPEHKEIGINDGVLMSSRDGLHFERWVEAFLRPGTEDKMWTDRNNYIAWGMAPTSDAELSLYWTEHYRYPTYRLRRGTIRTDGFVSIHAGAKGGELLTRPMVFSGKELQVNYETSAIGSLQFALCDEAGKAYEGFSLGESERLYGNEIAHAVSWQTGTNASSLAGKPVRLRVRLKDADLFSVRFAD